MEESSTMVDFWNIKDNSAIPTRVWLSREKEVDVWQPLRKADCQVLNENPDRPHLIEGGRATADPEFGVIRYNFYSHPELSLTSTTWFVRDDRENSENPILIPMPEEDAKVVEQLYQKVLYASSTTANEDGLESILKEEVDLEGGNYKAMVKQHDANTYIIKKIPAGWGFGRSYDLQRGYGEYTVEGEKEEMMLGPVRHLVFVIHGVGEVMWNRDGITEGNLTSEVATLRLQMQKQQIDEWTRECDTLKANQTFPPPPNRVEFIPIYWYDRIHSSSTSLMQSINATTLKTIPALRAIGNDVILDVLMYLTPNFCYDVLECVTDQIIETFEIFKKTHPDFASDGGKCSLIGHSLGSVICWDLLSIAKEMNNMDIGNNKVDDHGMHITRDGYSADVGYQQYASAENANAAKNGSWGPSLPKAMKRRLPFVPDFTVFLGSPLGLFLTLRGAHPVFDELREVQAKSSGRKSKASPFTLPSGTIHNIFHPNDPVAYRIEPLLLAQGTEDIPEPLYLTREGKGVRLHVKAKQISDGIRRSILGTPSAITGFMNDLTSQAQSLLQQMDNTTTATETMEEEEFDRGPLRFSLAGRNDRLDYQLQPRVIDNEYLSAVSAHSNYFASKDITDYIIDLTRTKQTEVIDLTDSDMETS